jgi:hypothetical protein
LGTKSGSRRIFLKAQVKMPPGAEYLKNYHEIVHAVSALKEMYPDLKKAVIKLNDGFSGDGNAIINYPDFVEKEDLFKWLHQNLYKEIQPVAKDLTVEKFLEKFEQMQGIVEAFVEGKEKDSPSVQCRINPLGEIDIISTHDQVLNGHVFIGAHFPAADVYRNDITTIAKVIANELKKEGVLGRFGIDFISVKENEVWNHYAIEINLRKGGTTHPFLMLQFLTNGHYNEDKGIFETAHKQKRYYFASDNMQNKSYIGLCPKDIIDIAMYHGLHFDGPTQKGIMFHMIGAVSQFGKMGIVCIGASKKEAYDLYTKAVDVFNRETAIR